MASELERAFDEHYRPAMQRVLDESKTNYDRVDAALKLLREARDLLVEAGAEKTAARARLAISSACGARRHAAHEKYRLARKAARS